MLEFENTSNFNFSVSIGSHGKHEFDQFMQFCQDNNSLDESVYSSKEVQKKADISKIQLIHWSQSGVIIPADDARGRGNRRKYSFQNLVEASICKELNSFRVESNSIKALLENLRAEYVFKIIFNMFMAPIGFKFIEGKANEILRTDSEKPYCRDEVFEFTFKSTIWKVLQYLKVFEDKPILFLVFHLTKQSDDVDYPAAFSILQDDNFNDYFVNLKTALVINISSFYFANREA